MAEQRGRSRSRQYPRRRFLRDVGAAGLAGLAAPIVAGPWPRRAAAAESPIRQVVVCCQENHSFDNYLGSYSGLPSSYAIPPDWTVNSGVKPFHFTMVVPGYDPDHSWDATHKAYDGGKMDGFVDNGNGDNAMGYYDGSDLSYYYQLAQEYTLCANYFCGILGPTYPNRLVLFSGTSGGYTENGNIPLNGLTWPCIIDLLQDHKVSWKNYNFYCQPNHSLLAMWKVAYGKPELAHTQEQFFTDCEQGMLPQVSFITDDENWDSWSEHPPANPSQGEGLMREIITAVQRSPQWSSTAVLLTYDEGGGYFDHLPPKSLDAFGSGIRVPMIVVSPLARKGFVDTTYSDHGSVLKFIEHVFNLPALASINHDFDQSTPSGIGEGGGAAFPPRDGNPEISDLTQCFNSL